MSDLIERLRAVQANAATMDSVKLAADCVEAIESWRQAMQKADRDIDELRDRLTEANMICGSMQDEITKLKGQLYVLRPSLCAMIATGNTRVQDPRRFLIQAKMIAASNGWDCSKEKP